jgi:hypothetical protein
LGWSEVEELTINQMKAVLARESSKPGRMAWDDFDRIMNSKRMKLRI